MRTQRGRRFICSYFTVFSAYRPQKHECFCPEASKSSYFTVFPTYRGFKTLVFYGVSYIPRLRNPRILRCFLHGMPQKHECFCSRGFKILVFYVFSAWFASKTRVFFAANAENARKWVPFWACELKMLQNGFRETKNELFESLKFRP